MPDLRGVWANVIKKAGARLLIEPGTVHCDAIYSVSSIKTTVSRSLSAKRASYLRLRLNRQAGIFGTGLFPPRGGGYYPDFGSSVVDHSATSARSRTGSVTASSERK
jgi:hypothetical protein